MTKEAYQTLSEQAVPPSKWLRNALRAFCTGGAICAMAQLFFHGFTILSFSETEASLLVNLVLIGATTLLTGFGLFSKLGKFCGAGTFIPITGFANAVVSPAIEYRTEGLIFGTAAKMFTVAGPVLVFGTVSSVAMGMLRLLFLAFFA